MMKMSFEVTARKLFGVKYERLARTLFLDLVVFWGLHIAGFQVQIASSILYLMTSAFSAGVMWQALSSGDNRANLENMLMLPFEGRTLVFSYVAALGAYTLLTKTAGLLAVVWAVSEWSWAEILGSVQTPTPFMSNLPAAGGQSTSAAAPLCGATCSAT